MIASLISLMGAIDLPHLVRTYSTMYEKAIGSEMSQADNESSTQRVPLNRMRVLRGAIAVADAGGIGSLTIRSLAQHLSIPDGDLEVAT